MDLTAEHLVALLVLAAVTAALCAAARRRPDGPTAALLGAFTIGADAATILAAAALWSRRRALVELLWFWACAGTVQALLTPDVPERFPGLLWFQYYGAHGGIVAAALLLVVGLRLRPRPGAWARAALLTAAYAVAVGAVDLLTGGDYLYLRRPPLSPSLLDLMGPWPWYLVWAAALAVVLFLLLQAPFRERSTGASA